MEYAAELCGVSRHTAAEWFRRYERCGITEILHLKTVPGRCRTIPAEVAECMKKRLPEAEEFGSYEIVGSGIFYTGSPLA